MSKNTQTSYADIFDAARNCDPQTVKKFIDDGADLTLSSEYGFTALQCAAMGSNSCAEESRLMKTLRLLIDAGSPLEAKSKDGRTALFLLAEFSPFVAPVQLLIDAGANADVSDSHGNHITVNAMMEEVQELLSEVTGVALVEPEPELQSVKMSSKSWHKASKAIGEVFESLTRRNIIALADAGYTQSDGFADCAERLHGHPDANSVIGFCFYTRQDLNTAKESSQLYLGIWGAPEGKDEETIAIGKLAVDIFKQHGFEAEWNGTASVRPCILLYHFN